MEVTRQQVKHHLEGFDWVEGEEDPIVQLGDAVELPHCAGAAVAATNWVGFPACHSALRCTAVP